MADQANQFLATRGLIGGLFDNTANDAMDELHKNQNIYNNIALPSSQWKNVDTSLVDPESANYALSQDDPAMKAKQLDALSKMGDLAGGGQNAQDDLAFARARQMGDQMAQAKTAAVMNNANARGVGGGGLEFALREQGNQDASQRAQDAALQQAASSAQQRNQYMQAYAGQLGQARQQDYNTNKNNTDVVNQFNMANTQARNQAATTNAAAKNQMGQYNQTGATNLAQNNFNDALGRAKGETDANSGMAAGYAAQNAANNSARKQDTQTLMDGFKMGMG